MLTDALKGMTVLHHLIAFAKDEFEKAKVNGQPTDPMSCFYFGLKTWNDYLAKSELDCKSIVLLMQSDIGKFEKAMDDIDKQS